VAEGRPKATPSSAINVKHDGDKKTANIQVHMATSCASALSAGGEVEDIRTSETNFNHT